jgi:hypothetical protein
MNIKNYFYTNHGILIKDSEAFYFNYLQENYDMKLDKVLKTFLENCETRYYSQKHIHDIRMGLIKEEIGRDIKTGDAGNITRAQILEDEFDVTSEEAVDTVSGKDIVYIKNNSDENNSDENNHTIEVDQGDQHVLNIKLLNKLLTRQN